MGSRFPNRCQNPGNEIPNILVHEVYVIDITPSAFGRESAYRSGRSSRT
jgi:hypothetical protein